MSSKSANPLIQLYKKKDFGELKLESTIEELEGCLSKQSLEPENFKQVDYSPNDIIVVGKHFDKKKIGTPVKKDSKKEERREKVYRKGPLAKFYILNQSTLDKNANVWYYKDGKQIIGPVSSYNMDKMVWLKSINSETRVSFKNLDKFVKLEKILKIVQQNYKQQSQSDEEDD